MKSNSEQNCGNENHLTTEQRAKMLERRVDEIWRGIKQFCSVAEVSTREVVHEIVVRQLAFENSQICDVVARADDQPNI